MADAPFKPKIEYVNRRAEFEYFFDQMFEAGLLLSGTEIKAIRAGSVNLNDAYCYFEGGDLFVRSLYIGEYGHGNQFNHEPRRPRKLLLRRPELAKLERKVKERGYTIVPYRLFVSERGFAKLDIALARGKKSFDKRETIKEKDNKREMDRLKKIRL
jgi:SsrA-binding protein